MRFLLAAIVVAATALPALPAAGAPVTPPLRTLVYHVEYAVQTTNEEHTSGMSGTTGGGMNNSAGSGTVRRSADVGDDGTLTIGVIAATPDGGLVVDCSYAGSATQQPVIRVAIGQDGVLHADPKLALSAEAVHLLPLFARGFVAGRTLDVGAKWREPETGANGIGYSVTGIDDQTAAMRFDGLQTVGGSSPYNEQISGTLRYETARLCPLTVELAAASQHTAGTQYVTTHASLRATLSSDTFDKK